MGFPLAEPANPPIMAAAQLGEGLAECVDPDLPHVVQVQCESMPSEHRQEHRNRQFVNYEPPWLASIMMV